MAEILIHYAHFLGIIVFASLLVAGLSLWHWVGKPANFYTANPVFHAKLTAFVLMALLSMFVVKACRSGRTFT